MDIKAENQPNDKNKDTDDYEHGPVDNKMTENEARGSISTISNSDTVNGIPNDNMADDEQIDKDRDNVANTHKDILPSEEQPKDDDNDIVTSVCKYNKVTNASTEQSASNNPEYDNSPSNVKQPIFVTEEPSQTDQIEVENIITDVNKNKLKEQTTPSQHTTDEDHTPVTLKGTSPELTPEHSNTTDANKKTKEDNTSNLSSNAKDNCPDACSNNGKTSKETHCSQKGQVQHNKTLEETGRNTENDSEYICETNLNENGEIFINYNADNPLDKSNENESDMKCDEVQNPVEPDNMSKENYTQNPEQSISLIEKAQQINPIDGPNVSNDIDTGSTVNTTAKSDVRHSDKEPEKVDPDTISINNPSDPVESSQHTTSTENDTGEQATTAHGADDPRLNANLEFYRNKRKSSPYPGYKIDKMLEWYGDFKELERNHRYIQWLFPLYEASYYNTDAQALQLHEAEAIRNDPVLKSRVLKAFEMMLNFYGMKLLPGDSVEIGRAEEGIWKDRFQHLNKSGHNYLRITRILRSISYLGYQHLQYPWIRFILQESQRKGTLLSNLRGGNMGYWINSLENSDEQEQALKQWTMSSDDAKASSDSKNDEPRKNTKHDEESTNTKNDLSKSIEETNCQHMNSNTKTDKAAASSEQIEVKTNKDQNDESEMTNKATGQDNRVGCSGEKQVEETHKNNADATIIGGDINKQSEVQDKIPNKYVEDSFTSGESGSHVLNPNKEDDNHTNFDDAKIVENKATLASI